MSAFFCLQNYWNGVEKQYNLEYSKELDNITNSNIIDYEYLASFINNCFSHDIELSIIFYTSQTIPSVLDFDRMLLASGSKIKDIIYVSEGNYKFSTDKIENVRYLWSINNKYDDKKIVEILNRFNNLYCFS